MVDINAAITTAEQTIAANSGKLAGTRDSVADSYDTFLSLLTTQLKNQDPTDPLDTNEFTQQLIQYTEVEQLLQSNKNLEALLQLSSASAQLSMINYVGKEITSKGDTVSLGASGSASWQLDAAANAEDVTYVVKDAGGNEVYSASGSLNAGPGSFSWDGTTSSGARAPAGNYSLTVTARNSSEQAVKVDLSVKGLVDGVDMSGETPVLLVNGTRFSVSDVKQIHSAS